MLVRDEKILLIAKASAEQADIYRAVKQVVNNCIFDVSIDKLTTFDIEYMFIKIRSASIGNTVELSFKDLEDQEEYNFIVDLDEVYMVYPEDVDAIVKLSDTMALKLRYPPATLFDDEKAIGDNAYEWIASKCIDTVLDGDDVYSTEDSTEEELLDYIMSLDTKSYNKVKSFIANMPRLEYIISYTNKHETVRKLALTTLTDFFTLR